MKIVDFRLVCALALAGAVPAFAQYPAPTASGAMNGSMSGSSMSTSGTKIYNLNSENGSNESGTVTLSPQGPDKTIVSVDLTGAPGPQPVHIHQGTCANLNPAPAYPLENIRRGHSRTVVDAPIGKLTGGGYAVNAHQSLTDLKDYVACGDLIEANAAPKSAVPSVTAPAKGGS